MPWREDEEMLTVEKIRKIKRKSGIIGQQIPVMQTEE